MSPTITAFLETPMARRRSLLPLAAITQTHFQHHPVQGWRKITKVGCPNVRRERHKLAILLETVRDISRQPQHN